MISEQQLERLIKAFENVANSGENIAHALRQLGNADAATPMGAIEALGAVHKEGMADIADAMREGLTDIATNILDKGEA